MGHKHPLFAMIEDEAPSPAQLHVLGTVAVMAGVNDATHLVQRLHCPETPCFLG
jgi:hypothetical protein